MSHDDPPLSMVAANIRVNLRNFCEFGTDRLSDCPEGVSDRQMNCARTGLRTPSLPSY